jgi:mono/diheme cytochrome c family protein
VKHFTSLLLLLALAAFPVAAQQGTDPSWTAPEKDAARKNPFAGKPELAAGGQKVFSRTCATCHGDATHRATTNAPDLGSEAVQAQSDGAIFWKITNGNTKKAMPSWGSIPEPQRWQLVLYVRSLREKK